VNVHIFIGKEECTDKEKIENFWCIFFQFHDDLSLLI